MGCPNPPFDLLTKPCVVSIRMVVGLFAVFGASDFFGFFICADTVDRPTRHGLRVHVVEFLPPQVRVWEWCLSSMIYFCGLGRQRFQLAAKESKNFEAWPIICAYGFLGDVHMHR